MDQIRLQLNTKRLAAAVRRAFKEALITTKRSKIRAALFCADTVVPNQQNDRDLYDAEVTRLIMAEYPHGNSINRNGNADYVANQHANMELEQPIENGINSGNLGRNNANSGRPSRIRHSQHANRSANFVGSNQQRNANLRHSSPTASPQHLRHQNPTAGNNDDGRRQHSNQNAEHAQLHQQNVQSNQQNAITFADENHNPNLNNENTPPNTRTNTSSSEQNGRPGRTRRVTPVASPLRPINANNDGGNDAVHQPRQSTNNGNLSNNNNNYIEEIVQHYMRNNMEYMITTYSGLNDQTLQSAMNEQQQHQQRSVATTTGSADSSNSIEYLKQQMQDNGCCDSENNDGETNCTICLEKITPTSRDKQLTSCQHTFHRDCVDTWLVTVQTCPLCRGEVDIRDLIGVNVPPTVQSGHYVLDVTGREVRRGAQRFIFTGSMSAFELSPGESITINDRNGHLIVIVRGFSDMLQLDLSRRLH
ncbi:hypothetical protein niasHS_002942 [Heterodera schachtii]|uniref:RING-type domain-containing protein n=1 Tax=Heterodera schachtii TaxID=97005 RepID=A0ABD2K993_HETSC